VLLSNFLVIYAFFSVNNKILTKLVSSIISLILSIKSLKYVFPRKKSQLSNMIIKFAFSFFKYSYIHPIFFQSFIIFYLLNSLINSLLKLTKFF